jgi:hypothetical protein
MGRRRSSDQRNLLYNEPSWWGIAAIVAVAVAAITGMMAFLLL